MTGGRGGAGEQAEMADLLVSPLAVRLPIAGWGKGIWGVWQQGVGLVSRWNGSTSWSLPWARRLQLPPMVNGEWGWVVEDVDDTRPRPPPLSSLHNRSPFNLVPVTTKTPTPPTVPHTGGDQWQEWVQQVGGNNRLLSHSPSRQVSTAE